MNRPIELLEESLQTLRGAGTAILLPHWIGAVPFAITLLVLWNDMRLSWGSPLLLRDSLLCAIAFLWLSYWKSRSSRATFTLLHSASEILPPSIWLQSIFQMLKLFVMPLAVVSLLAWPAASAFFRVLAVEPLSKDRTIRGAFKRALAAATSRYLENLLASLIIAALALVTYVNVLIVFLALPTAWKTLTGVETQWSSLGTSAVPGLFVIAGITTWILIDPWIQTYCLLRVFYRNARSDGRDLLRNISRLTAILLLCLVSAPAHAQVIDAQTKLNQSIDRVAQRSDYGWLRPPASAHDRTFLNDIAEKINSGVTAVSDRIRLWLRRLFYSSETHHDDKPAQPIQTQSLRWTLALLALLICAAIIALFLRRGRSARLEVPSASTTPIADILNEHLLPSEVNQEEWLRQALEYLSNNQTRLAARAFYLANLSYLGAQRLLVLSLSKTNNLYERELARQPKATPLTPAFTTANRLYERAWYGMRELETGQVDSLKACSEQLRQHA